MGRRKGRQRHTEFREMSLDDISRLARDPTVPTPRRRKAQTEEKERKLRNRQKRESS